MISYNDEYPESLSADPTLKVPSFWPGGAHAKGVIGLGDSQGFWLVHSMPQFPGEGPLIQAPGFANGRRSKEAVHDNCITLIRALLINNHQHGRSLRLCKCFPARSDVGSFLNTSYEFPYK